MPLIKPLARVWISVVLMLSQIGFFLYSYTHPGEISLMSNFGVLCIAILWLTYVASAGRRERTARDNFKGGLHG